MFVNAKIDCLNLYCFIPNNYNSLGIILLLYGHINLNCFFNLQEGENIRYENHFILNMKRIMTNENIVYIFHLVICT